MFRISKFGNGFNLVVNIPGVAFMNFKMSANDLVILRDQINKLLAV